MNLESQSLYAEYFGARFGGALKVKLRSSLVLKVQVCQSCPVQQHDLPLSLAEEAKDAHAVKV